MILCVYHGSTFKDVNELQTGVITEQIRATFTDHRVEECYYSEHVQKIMERRNTPIKTFAQALEENYREEEIYVLLTNMMNGIEYQKILQIIKLIDVQKKVKHTKNLLDSSIIDELAMAIVNRETPTLFIGHGNDIDNQDYQLLNSKLVKDNNIVTTLKNEQIIELVGENTLIKPLMITSAFHAKKDIEVTLYNQCLEQGIKPQLDLSPLALNPNIHQLLINQLLKLIQDN